MSQADLNFYVASYLVNTKKDIDKSLAFAKISNPLFALFGKNKGRKIITSK